MAKAKTAKRKDEVAIMGGGPYPLVPLPGARNIRTLSARFIADMQEHWEKHGMEALDTVFQKFPDRYVDNYVMLSRIIRLEADVKHSMAKPKTIAEALDELEGKVGKDGRRKFEKFLRSMGEELDDEDDAIDVGSK
jgi:hypothetical protein